MADDRLSRVPEGQPGPRRGAVERAVRAHLDRRYDRPIRPEQREVLAAVESARTGHDGEIWLDAGCGTGQSTRTLARNNPSVLVIGVDKSARRLTRSEEPLPANARIVRADLVDLWLHAEASGWIFDKTWLLYPNPWPKTVHLKRRWYAHPVFPALLRTCRRWEMRTNWEVYAREMAWAVEIVEGEAPGATIVAVEPDSEISAFERKYAASGHTLYRLAHARPMTHTMGS